MAHKCFDPLNGWFGGYDPPDWLLFAVDDDELLLLFVVDCGEPTELATIWLLPPLEFPLPLFICGDVVVDDDVAAVVVVEDILLFIDDDDDGNNEIDCVEEDDVTGTVVVAVVDGYGENTLVLLEDGDIDAIELTTLFGPEPFVIVAVVVVVIIPFAAR